MQRHDGMTAGPDGQTTTLFLILIIAASWLATRPYVGVVHDSRFYTVQALGALLPGRFDHDLYFRYGSQDQFTIFTLIYKPALAALGIARAAMALTIVGQGLWISGLFYLAYGLFPDRHTALVAIATAIILPAGIMFNYAEQFITPRLLAEAITLWALGLMLRGRPAWALLLLGFSVTVHPLVAVPGFAVLFLYEAAERPVCWVIVGVALSFSLALAHLDIQPFARLSETYDPAWLAVVRVRDSFCLLSEWSLDSFFRAFIIFVLAALALAIAETHERKFLIATLAVAIGGLVAMLLGGDFLHNVLVADVQQHRATWLLALTANLFVGVLLLRTPWAAISRLTRTELLCALGFIAATTFVTIGVLLAVPFLAFAAFVFVWERKQRKPLPAIAHIVFAVAFAATIMPAIDVLLKVAAWAIVYPDFYWHSTQGLAIAIAAVLAAAIYATVSTRVRRRLATPFILFAAALAAVGVLGWDQRSPWTKFVETTDEPPPSLTALLPNGKQIYWEGDVRFPWFVLKRPNYFSCAQGTGSLFFRATALAYQHRYDSFAPLRTLDFGQEIACPVPPGPNELPFTHGALVSVCTHEPELGALVLTRPVPETPAQVWTSPVEFEDYRPQGETLRRFATNRFFIYTCDGLR